MSPYDPRHGKYAGAIAHWRDREPLCDPCNRAQRRARKSRHIDVLRGNPRMVELGDEAHRILTTVPLRLIRELTGIRGDKLIAYRDQGPSKRLHRTTRDRLLAVSGWTVIGLTRRLQALSCLGWSMQALSPEVGVHHNTLQDIRRGGERTFIRIEVGRALVEGYDRLCLTGPATTGRGTSATIGRARRAGWLPPLAWDDIDHDPVPVDETAARTVGRPRQRDRVIENAEWMADADENLTAVCDRLDIAPETLYQTCRRARRLDLYAKLSRREPDGDMAITMRKTKGAA